MDKNLRAGLGVAKRQINCVRFADCRRLERWPEIVLQRYCEGRLDELANAFEPLQKLLRGLLEDGFAIQNGASWHPLYTIGDQWLDLRVVNRLKTMLNGEMS